MENTGFKNYVVNSVVVAAGATVPLDVTLELGTTQQTVEVVANAQLLQTEAGRVATEVSNKLVDELPVVVNGAVRSPFDLSGTTAEVASAGQYRVGGGRGGAYGMTLDGILHYHRRPVGQQRRYLDPDQYPSVDALTEFSVTSAGFKADVGHASGGTMSFVSKSGTNDFHGTAYEFLRNQKLDAKGFFGATKPVYKQNDFGFTAGGPVRIPKLYNGRDKTFFFFSYEGFRNRAGASPTPYSIPPQEFYTGDLHNYVDASGKMYQIYDPATTTLGQRHLHQKPFPNNQIPQTRIDPVAKSIIGYVQPLLQSNVSGTGARNLGLRPQQLPLQRHHHRAERQIQHQGRPGADREAAALVLLQPQPAEGPLWPHRRSGPAQAAGRQSRIQPLGRLPHQSRLHHLSDPPEPLLRRRKQLGAEPRVLSPLTKTRRRPRGSPPPTWDGKSKGICIPNYPDCNVAFPQVNFSNSEFTNWGVAAPNGSDNIVVEFHDDMTKTSGAHTFKWGYYPQQHPLQRLRTAEHRRAT